MLSVSAIRNVFPVFHREEAATYRPELDPIAWDYFRGRITPAQLHELCGSNVKRKVAIVQFSPAPEWKGLDEHGNLIVRPAWRRRTH